MGAEETKEKKRVLITYFGKYKGLGMNIESDNENISFMTAKCMEQSVLDDIFYKDFEFEFRLLDTEEEKLANSFNKDIFPNKYHYIISLGQTGNMPHKKCILERINNYHKFNLENWNAENFEIHNGCELFAIQPCLKTRNRLYDYAKENRDSKVEFIHIPQNIDVENAKKDILNLIYENIK